MVATTAICEKDRLEMSRDQDTRLSGFWLIPRFFLVGVAEAFAYVDQLVFFITQAHERKKSMRKALSLSTLAMGFNAVIMTECKATNEDRSNLSAASTVTQVEEVKMVIKLIPIWTTAIKITRDPKGRKYLQRIGIGLILAVARMVAATAICEKNRLETSRDQDTRLSGFWLIHRCLDKAVIVTGCKAANEDRSNLSPVSIVTQVEEVKIVIKLIPIWTTAIKITRDPKGLRCLQRIGIGLIPAVAGMVATTALCEKNMLEMSQDQDTRLSGFWLIRRCLDKAVIVTECKARNEDRSNLSLVSTVTQVEEVKMMIKLIPIWSTSNSSLSNDCCQHHASSHHEPKTWCLDKAVIVTKCKARNEDRSNLSLVSTVTQVEEVKMVIKLISIWSTVGVAEAFAYVGQLVFFITQAPERMKSISKALCLSALTMGFYVSSFLVWIINKTTHENWLKNDFDHGKWLGF
ncbi:NRT1/ PTR family protein 6.4 [Tanacetum coccineum]